VVSRRDQRAPSTPRSGAAPSSQPAGCSNARSRRIDDV
jgi:hypothetical protein